MGLVQAERTITSCLGPFKREITIDQASKDITDMLVRQGRLPGGTTPEETTAIMVGIADQADGHVEGFVEALTLNNLLKLSSSPIELLASPTEPVIVGEFTASSSTSGTLFLSGK